MVLIKWVNMSAYDWLEPIFALYQAIIPMFSDWLPVNTGQRPCQSCGWVEIQHKRYLLLGKVAHAISFQKKSLLNNMFDSERNTQDISILGGGIEIPPRLRSEGFFSRYPTFEIGDHRAFLGNHPTT